MEIIKTYDYYTLEQAKKVIKEEKRQRIETAVKYIKSVGLGITLILSGLICPLLLEGDITATIFIVPIGISEIIGVLKRR